MKKVLALLLALVMVLALGCTASNVQQDSDPTATAGDAQNPDSDQDANGDGTEDAENWKIAIMTSTVTQGEESYRAAEMVAEEYPGHILHVTFPDNFTTEQEVALSTILSVAADPEVKALLISGTPAGFAAMIDKLKEQRPDIMVWAGSPSDDISVISAAADVVFNTDIAEQGYQLAEAAYEMGAKMIVHYSFPRHMAVELLLQRRNNMEERAKELGITFIDATTPDPTSDAGTTGTQQFVLEDVPKMIEQYGKDTAFFGTNQAQVEPMIKTVLENGGIFLMPNDPSPFIGYPSALGIEIPDEYQGDADYAAEQISAKLAEMGMTGRAGNWAISLQVLNLKAGAAYAVHYINGDTNGELFDYDVFVQTMQEVVGPEVSINQGVDNTGATLENYMMILGAFMTY